MRDNSRLLGIDMGRRGNRRWLVALVMLSLLGLWAISLAQPERQREASMALLWTSLAVNFVLFGGYGRWGLIRPFHEGPPNALNAGVREDEREKGARDRAHFYAYRAVIIVLLLGYVAQIEFVGGPETTRAFLLGLAEIGMTLPQALLLWSEPSLED